VASRQLILVHRSTAHHRNTVTFCQLAGRLIGEFEPGAEADDRETRARRRPDPDPDPARRHGSPQASRAPCGPHLPIDRDGAGCWHVVLVDVQSQERRPGIDGLEAPLGPLDDAKSRSGDASGSCPSLYLLARIVYLFNNAKTTPTTHAVRITAASQT
ncbi:Uncharacterized protein TPAR_05813, partial [Tolypocladium paradoxum]